MVRKSSAYLLGRGELEVEHRLEVEPHAALGPPVREARVERAAVARQRLLGAEELQRGQRRRRAHVQPGCVQWYQRLPPGLTAGLGGLAMRGAAIAGL